MNEMSRRDAVRFAAGLAVGSGALCVGAAFGQQQRRANAAAPAEPAKPVDEMLDWAKRHPESFMLSEPVSFVLEGDNHSRDLYITSALDEYGKSARVRIPSHAVRIFRADSRVDDFTKQGGIRWQFFGKDGKVQLKSADREAWTGDPKLGQGAIVMVMRQGREIVRCFTMSPDERC